MCCLNWIKFSDGRPMLFDCDQVGAVGWNVWIFNAYKNMCFFGTVFFYLKHTWYLVFWVFRVSNWKTTISLEYHQKNVISFGAHQILKSLWHYHNKKYFRLFVFASFTFSINCLFFVVCFVFLFLYVSIRWHIRWNCSHFSNFLSLIPSIYFFFFDMEDPLNLAQFFYRIFGNLHGFLNETEVPAKSTILTAN